MLSAFLIVSWILLDILALNFFAGETTLIQTKSIIIIKLL